jgi:hypothetical protein
MNSSAASCSLSRRIACGCEDTNSITSSLYFTVNFEMCGPYNNNNNNNNNNKSNIIHSIK